MLGAFVMDSTSLATPELQRWEPLAGVIGDRTRNPADRTGPPATGSGAAVAPTGPGPPGPPAAGRGARGARRLDR